MAEENGTTKKELVSHAVILFDGVADELNKKTRDIRVGDDENKFSITFPIPTRVDRDAGGQHAGVGGTDGPDSVESSWVMQTRLYEMFDHPWLYRLAESVFAPGAVAATTYNIEKLLSRLPPAKLLTNVVFAYR